jgi:para-aminobenzoate synthetase component 1
MPSSLPLVEELLPAPDVLAAVRAVRQLPRTILLESALRREHVGRFSFLTADPFRVLEVPRVAHGSDPLAMLAGELAQFTAESVPGLPPFQGGVAGLIGYEAGQVWERLPRPQFQEFPVSDIFLGIYDWVLAWDHQTGQAWLISQGFPETDPQLRERRARERLTQIKALLQANVATTWTSNLPDLTATELAPQFALPGLAGVTSNFPREKYLQTVQRAIDYIYAGDVFQVNLSQRLLAPLRDDPLDLYARLRVRNPAPFAAYFEHPDWVIASASPERFVRVAEGEVETRPIKGTRRRQTIPEADLFTGDELRESEKDLAENVMIVDLLRNDLSRVCQPGSIRVPELCVVETYETVQHLVSEVRGRLRAGATGLDLLAAAFPGGSITGAPKVRAMEIIAELEPTVRGPYCGSLCYVGFDGQLDSSILIRTFTVSRGWIQFPVGGGIVAQSDPESEYLETLQKAAGMLRAL